LPALETLPATAEFHRAVGAVHQTLGNALPSEVATSLERLYREDRARHLLVMRNLRRVGEVMKEIGVPFLVVKGPVLAQVAYSRPPIRSYRDLDLIVPGASFATAFRALEERGAEVIDPNWSYLDEHVAGELELTTGVDLHWHFLFSQKFRATIQIRMEEVFERAREVEVGGEPVRTLDPPDTLIHLALHACKEGGRRLIWLKDVEQSVLNDRPDWDEVVRRAHDWGVGLFVGTILLRTARLLDLAVPATVTRELIPSRSWRTVLASADRIFPVDVWTGRETPATLVVEATRTNGRATLAHLARGAAARGGRALHRDGARRSIEETIPSSSQSESREAFLKRVGTER
jgi:hypothetical protein